jgi:hypothetical protein
MLVWLFGWDYQVLQLVLALGVVALSPYTTTLSYEVVHGV